jgi:hypothetical protein
LVLIASGALAKSSDEGRRAYDKDVRTHTERSYRQNKDVIDPDRLRGKGHDLDHITPRGQGYREGIPAHQMGSPENLRMLPSQQNRSEGCRGACPR